MKTCILVTKSRWAMLVMSVAALGLGCSDPSVGGASGAGGQGAQGGQGGEDAQGGEGGQGGQGAQGGQGGCVASPEVCNGVDDDCDGEIDNGDLCESGGACATNVCEGAVGCVSTPLPDGTACGASSACGTPVCGGGSCLSTAPSTTPWDVEARGYLGYLTQGWMEQIEAAGRDTIVGGVNCDSWDIGLGPSETGSAVPPDSGGATRCEVLISKIDDSGNALWMTRPSHGFYYVYLPSLDVDPLFNTYAMVTPYDWQGFDGRGYLSKLDPAGAEQWSFALSPAPNDFLSPGSGTVQVANNGDILVSFIMGDAFSGVNAHHISRITPAGTLVWTSMISPVTAPYPASTVHGLVEDAAGDIYAPGIAGGTLVVGSSTITAGAGYVAKFSSTGTPAAALQLPAGVSVAELRRDSTGTLHLAGRFTGTVTLGASTLVSAGSNDVVLARFDSGLNLLGAASFGGAGNDFPTGFVVDAADTLRVFGTYDASGTGANGISFGGPTLGAVTGPTGYLWSGHARVPMFLASLTTTYGHVATRGFAKGGPKDIDADCNDSVLLSGTTQELQAIDLGITPPSSTVAFATRLGPPGDACGAGSCAGASFVDGCTTYAPTAAISLAACACNLVDPACGAGSCYAGQYCSGDACGPEVCYPTTDPRSRALCNGGALSGSCVASGGTKTIFSTNATFSGNLGGLSGADALCQAAATAAGLPGSYEAMLGDASEDLWTHGLSGFEGALVRVDGAVVYPTESALGPRSYVIESNSVQTELSTVPPVATFWVGAGCADWTNGASGTAIVTTQGLYSGVGAGAVSCSTTNAVVCVEQ